MVVRMATREFRCGISLHKTRKLPEDRFRREVENRDAGD